MIVDMALFCAVVVSLFVGTVLGKMFAKDDAIRTGFFKFKGSRYEISKVGEDSNE